MKYSIQPHGNPGNFILLMGHDSQHHGYNLCTLSNFDNNGEMTRETIVEGLNYNVRLTAENQVLSEKAVKYEGLKNKIKGKDKAFMETLARQLHKRNSSQPFDTLTEAEKKLALLDADDFRAMVFE